MSIQDLRRPARLAPLPVSEATSNVSFATPAFEAARSAASKRRQDLYPDGLGESCCEIIRPGQLTVHQDRTDGQHSFEPQILSPIPCHLKSSRNACRLDRFLIDACGRLCPSPVMEGNSHHCSSLKH